MNVIIVITSSSIVGEYVYLHVCDGYTCELPDRWINDANIKTKKRTTMIIIISHNNNIR